MFWNSNKRIYLDHAATTPINKEVLRVMNEIYTKDYFNPGSLYREGISASQIMADCRKKVSKLLGTTSDHIIFTRGGTESNNMAIIGVIENLITPLSLDDSGHLSLARGESRPHVIVSAIEHAAVLETVKDLEKSGKIFLSIAPVTEEGIIEMKELKKLLRPETVLVSVMYVNNEIGTIQPVKEIAKLIRWYKKQLLLSHSQSFVTAPLIKGSQAPIYPLLHVDAIQAVNYLDIHVERLGVDLMSLSGSKIYGPKSSGVLYVRNREVIGSLFHGGNQEFGLRAGTEDLAQIAGFTKAFELVRDTAESESKRLSDLQTYFLSELQKNISDLIVNGADRICNNINITIPGISGERLVIELDARGIAAASKSACKEDDGEASHVIAAIRPLATATDGEVRFTMGKNTKKADIDETVLEFVKIVNKIMDFERVLTNSVL
jgi:cysteine desulfurase